MAAAPTTVVIAARAPPGSSLVFRAACSPSLSQTCSAPPEALPTPATQSQRLHQDPGSQESENRPASAPLTPAVTHTPGLAPVACSHLWSGVAVGSVQGAWHPPSGLPGPLTLAPEWPLFLQGQNLLYCCWKRLSVTRAGIPGAWAGIGPVLGSGHIAPSYGGCTWVCPDLASSISLHDICLRLEQGFCDSPSIPCPGPLCAPGSVWGVGRGLLAACGQS